MTIKPKNLERKLKELVSIYSSKGFKLETIKPKTSNQSYVFNFENNCIIGAICIWTSTTRRKFAGIPSPHVSTGNPLNFHLKGLAIVRAK